MKARVTVQSISDELDEARDLAKRVEQPSAMAQAIVAKAKLHGLLIDRKESGAPGDFAGLGTPEEIIAKVREELGDEAAAILEASVEEKPEAAVMPVEPTNPGSGRLN